MKLNKLRIAVIITAAIIIFSCGNSNSGQNGLNREKSSYIPLIFTEVLEEEDGMNEYTKTKVIDINNGKELFTIDGIVLTLFREGFALANFEDGGYFINKKGEKKFGPYISATEFNEGIAFVTEYGGKIKAINTKGKALFTLDSSERANLFNEGMAICVDKDNRIAAVDKNGKTIELPISSLEGYTPWFINGTFMCQTQGEGGVSVTRLIDKNGNSTDLPYGVSAKLRDGGTDLISEIYSPMISGKLLAKQSDKYGVISTKGKWIINPQFDDIYADGEMYLFEKGNLYGWCDKNGNYIIPPAYKEAYPFGDNELTLVENKNGDLEYINKKGKMVLDASLYYSAMPFTSSGIAFVEDRSGDYGAIDRKGHYVINPQYQKIYYLSENRFLIENSTGQLGIIDEKGNYIMDPDFCSIDEELLESHGNGMPYFWAAISNFIDYEQITRLLKEATDNIVQVTSGQLKEKGIKESSFPKNGGYVTVATLSGDYCDIKVKAYFNTWTRKSDGWFGYNYVFNPDCGNGKYIISIEFTSRARANSSTVFQHLEAPVTLGEDGRTLRIGDKEFTIENTGRAEYRLTYII